MKTCCDWRILHCLTGSRATCLASKCAELISAEVVRKYAPTVCRVVLLYKVLDLFESLATCHVAGPPSAVANRTDSASFRGPSSIEFSLWKVFGFFKQRKFLLFFLLIFISLFLLSFGFVEFSARRSTRIQRWQFWWKRQGDRTRSRKVKTEKKKNKIF